MQTKLNLIMTIKHGLGSIHIPARKWIRHLPQLTGPTSGHTTYIY